MKQEKIKLLCMSGVLTSVVFLFTAYLHIPSHTGYTHIGDGFIYLAACILPLPYAMFVGSVGAMLADCLTGFAIWAPASVIIKILTVLLFSRKTKKIVSAVNMVALVFAGVVCTLGYYLYDALLTLNFITPLYGIFGYITQSILSSIVFVVLGMTLDRMNFKDRFLKGKEQL